MVDTKTYSGKVLGGGGGCGKPVLVSLGGRTDGVYFVPSWRPSLPPSRPPSCIHFFHLDNARASTVRLQEYYEGATLMPELFRWVLVATVAISSSLVAWALKQTIESLLTVRSLPLHPVCSVSSCLRPTS